MTASSSLLGNPHIPVAKASNTGIIPYPFPFLTCHI
jgi:hypothetical protein